MRDITMPEPLVTRIRGHHAASDNMIIVEDESGKKSVIPNLATKIDQTTTEVTLSSACEGTVCLRIDDNKHSDFWIEFNLDVPTLELLLAKAKASRIIQAKGTELHQLLFPQLEGDTWAEVNLNEIALQYDETVERADPATNEHWMTELHKMLGVDYSWGGWMEHRNHLLRHHYMKDLGNDHFWHLGIDYNVPAGTNVHLPVEAELICAFNDKDQDGGWGGKMIFRAENCYFILGHLGRMASHLRYYEKGEIVGTVGTRDVNGGWFPHLHVQCIMKLDHYVDGYSHRYEGIEKDFPDPKAMLEGVRRTIAREKR